MMTLHGYYRSSAAYRVRIALNLKGLAYNDAPVNLVKGEQRSDQHRLRNPQGLVPVLETSEGVSLSQSLAICEYLEEKHPEPAILPQNLEERARVRSLAQIVACDIHPLNNLKVLKYLVGTVGVDEEAKLKWYQHWVVEGFDALEARLTGERDTGKFCQGNTPTLADICLVPQVYNAERFECDLSPYPAIQHITAHCRGLEAFAKAAPTFNQ